MIPYELVGFSEIDKYAVKSYCAIHNVSPELNFGDIRELKFYDAKEKIDMMTWGFPCQDISVAGRLKGIEEGTRNGLYYQGIRILKETKPKYSIIENVKNLTSKRFEKEFEMILKDLDEAGYNSYWKVLNAKNYGVPQNRERVFIVSIRKDIDKGTFEFPEPIESEKRLKDVLEDTAVMKNSYPQYRIRRLTPLECWRLMGFDDSDYKKAKEIGMSDTQLYKQAGNSIVVNVLQKILDKLLKECD